MAHRLSALVGLASVLMIASCGGSETRPTTVPDEAEGSGGAPRPAPVVRLAPEGSRLTLDVPEGLTRVPHALRWRRDGLELRIADAQVQPGEERAIAEDYLARLTARHEGELTHRPVGVAGAHGYEVTIRGETLRVRALTVWHEGAISRLTVLHDVAAAADVERIVDSVRFDPARPIDAASALQVQAAVPEGLGVIPVTNEQIVLRRVDEEGRVARAVAFPHPEPSIDIAVIAFPDGDRPPSDLARGQLLGSRFAGLELGTPQMTAVAGQLQGFAILTTAPVDGADITLYGAYLEGEGAVVLVRASVSTEHAEEWLPRFAQLTLSLGLDEE